MISVRKCREIGADAFSPVSHLLGLEVPSDVCIGVEAAIKACFPFGWVLETMQRIHCFVFMLRDEGQVRAEKTDFSVKRGIPVIV